MNNQSWEFWLKENWRRATLIFSLSFTTPLAFYWTYNLFFEPEKASIVTLIVTLILLFYAIVGFYVVASPTKKISHQNLDSITLFFWANVVTCLAFYLAYTFFFKPEEADTATLATAFAILFYATAWLYITGRGTEEVGRQIWDNIALFLWVLLGTPLAFYSAYTFFDPEKAGTVALTLFFTAFFPATAGLYIAAKRIKEMNLQDWANIGLGLWVLLGTPIAFYFACKYFFDPEKAGTATLIAYIAAIFPVTGGLYLAARRTKEMSRQNEIAEQSNRIETFSRAVGQLGHQEQAVRQGAVAIFKQLGETPFDKQEKEGVINVLATFVRTQAPLHIRNPSFLPMGERYLHLPKDRKKRLDVEDAIKALASIAEGAEERRNVNLTSTDLRGLHLSDGKERTNLSFFHLINANLSETLLVNTNLSGAVLYRANLSGAVLYDANLSDARLEGANLSGAHLMGADLSESQLNNANLSAADLYSLKGTPQQDQFASIRYYIEHPPILPDGIRLPHEIGDPSKNKNIIQKGNPDYNKEDFEWLERRMHGRGRGE